MKDQVAGRGQQVDVAAQSLFHAALDAVALNGPCRDLAGGEADARAARGLGCGAAGICGARNQLMEADWRLRLAGISALIVGVLAQARSS